MENKPVILPPFLDLLKETWADMKKNFFRLVKISVLPLVVAMVFGIVAMILTALNASALVFVILGLIGVILLILVSLICGIALVRAVATGEEFMPAIRFGIKKIGSMAWLGILMGFVSIGLFMMGVLPFLASSIWFMFAAFILVTEDGKGLQALLKSKEYIRGYGWEMFGRLFFFGLIFFPIMLIIMLPGMINQDIEWASSILSNLVQAILIAPFGALFTFRLFKEMKERKPELVGTVVTRKNKLLKVSGIFGVITLIATIVVIIVAIPYIQSAVEEAARQEIIDSINSGDIEGLEGFDINSLEGLDLEGIDFESGALDSFGQ